MTIKNKVQINDSFQILTSFNAQQIEQIAHFFVANIVEGTIDCLRDEVEEDLSFSRVKQTIENNKEAAVDMFEDHMGYFMENVIKAIKKVNIKVEKISFDSEGLDDVDVTIE